MKYKKIILILSILIIMLGIAKGLLFLLKPVNNQNLDTIKYNSYSDSNKGYEKNQNINYKDKIILNNFKENQEITSPLEITGKARGSWFFEASFPVILTNWDGLIIAQGYATAQDNWMTEDFVDFTAKIEFEKPTLYNRGALILQKDNPSGLPENDDALEISIIFK